MITIHVSFVKILVLSREKSFVMRDEFYLGRCVLSREMSVLSRERYIKTILSRESSIR